MLIDTIDTSSILASAKYSFEADLVLNQLRIVTKFKIIRDLAAHENPADFGMMQGEEAANLWDDAEEVLAIADEILSLLSAIPKEDAEVQDRWHCAKLFTEVKECQRPKTN